MFRALAARALYLSMDRPDIMFASKELCRDFAAPTKESIVRLKKLVRYLVTKPRVVWVFKFESISKAIDIYSDTDFGGCLRTRRSTSGGVAKLGTHVIKCWSKTQSTVALSSAEAELTGICQAAGEGLGLQSLLHDLGWHVDVRVHADAAAAIGICRRRGLGRVRHLAVADLWIQDRLRTGDFSLHKVAGSDNVADMLTKHLERALLEKHMTSMQLIPEAGRAASTAKIDMPIPVCCLSRFHHPEIDLL